ncbi:hypothetical protein QFZ36_003955 [Pseudarthrobacter siccitolerans]|uniref:Uncharacterized protein n=1 Tax=Pseudarthrobacter siccitolerans TaxID=861266 RepID=A0ABU0PR05_9MICC|nr:hypothetical protein [Pseudarthrobacter siccitolerans]
MNPHKPGPAEIFWTMFVTILSGTGCVFLHWAQVMSASIKPRLAGRQPSNRGGVPRVRTWLSGMGWMASAARSAFERTGPMSKEP